MCFSNFRFEPELFRISTDIFCRFFLLTELSESWSCAGSDRCGLYFEGLTCQCDYDCESYDDCCYDFDTCSARPGKKYEIMRFNERAGTTETID